jgi:acyl-CoA thioesterase FadM
MVLAFPVRLPRYAFSPRDAARAGDIWRALQEVATDGSTARGWPPGRYRKEGVGFIVREMTVVHHRETPHGEALHARTWIKDFRRGLVTTREIRVDGELGPLAAGSQEWVHVKANHGRKDGEPMLKPARASASLLESFEVSDLEPSPVLPAYEAYAGARVHATRIGAWWTAMDPLGHANHPAYVDWADEALSRAMAVAGLDPLALAPVAERVWFKSGVVAPDEVTVRSWISGRTERGDAVFSHEIVKSDGVLAAVATTVRRLADGGADALFVGLS